MAFTETSSEWGEYRSVRKSAMRKNPVMDTWLGAERNIDGWNKHHGSLPVEELDDLAPNASVVFGFAGITVDVIWYLDDETCERLLAEAGHGSPEADAEGYHPGLFISSHDGGESYEVVSTCYFDSDRVFSKYGDVRTVSADELRQIIRDIESEYAGHFQTPRGIPVNYRH